jgi:hypothetical protein
VLDRSLIDFQEPILQWVIRRVPRTDETAALWAIKQVYRQQGADAFRVGLALAGFFGWPIDYSFTHLIHEWQRTIPEAIKLETTEWVVRTGYRFPAEVNDEIEWAGFENTVLAGTVIGVVRSEASAWATRAGYEDRAFFVPAEDVINNLTKAQFGGSRPAFRRTADD